MRMLIDLLLPLTAFSRLDPDDRTPDPNRMLRYVVGRSSHPMCFFDRSAQCLLPLDDHPQSCSQSAHVRLCIASPPEGLVAYPRSFARAPVRHDTHTLCPRVSPSIQGGVRAHHRGSIGCPRVHAHHRSGQRQRELRAGGRSWRARRGRLLHQVRILPSLPAARPNI